MADVIAVDVNETLLDLSALDPAFERVFGDAALRPQWFGQMLQLSFVGTITGGYVDFTTAQRAALRMLAGRTGTRLDGADAEAIIEGMRRLPPHPEVRGALEALRGSSLRVTALTNSVLAVAEEQLAHAGLRDLFDDVLSADAVRRLKPAPEPYRAVAARFGVPVRSVRLVAAHAWDVTGALAAGCQAAFVARGGVVASPLGPQPDITGPDLASRSSSAPNSTPGPGTSTVNRWASRSRVTRSRPGTAVSAWEAARSVSVATQRWWSLPPPRISRGRSSVATDTARRARPSPS